MSMTYGRFWRKVRQWQNYNQTQLAQKLGVAPAFISGVECDRRHFSLPQLITMIAIFELDVEMVVDVVMALEERKIRAAVRS